MVSETPILTYIIIAVVASAIVIPAAVMLSLASDAKAFQGNIPIDAIPVTNIADLSRIGTNADFNGYTWSMSATYYLTDNITLTGTNNLNPIGSSTSPFTGTFRGQQFTISGLSVSTINTTSGPTDSGLFGWTDGAIITDCNVIGAISASANVIDIGGIVAVAKNTEIQRCSYKGTINADSSTGGARGYSGGIVGSASGTTSITDCYSSATITFSASQGNSIAYAGGIVGRSTDTTPIVNCYSTCSVSGTTGTGNALVYSAGIVGIASSTPIVNCYFQTGLLKEKNSVIADRNIGIGSAIIDGVSVPARLTNPNQSTGAKTLIQLTPTLANAKANASVYYTGITDNSVLGWDFSSVWTIDPTKNNGLPIFADVKFPLEFDPIDDVPSFVGGQIEVSLNVNTYCTFVISNGPNWLSVSTDGMGSFFIIGSPEASGTFPVTVTASTVLLPLQQEARTFSLIVNEKLTFTTTPAT